MSLHQVSDDPLREIFRYLPDRDIPSVAAASQSLRSKIQDERHFKLRNTDRFGEKKFDPKDTYIRNKFYEEYSRAKILTIKVGGLPIEFIISDITEPEVPQKLSNKIDEIMERYIHTYRPVNFIQKRKLIEELLLEQESIVLLTRYNQHPPQSKDYLYVEFEDLRDIPML